MQRLPIEVKFFLALGAMLLILVVVGSGHLSFGEAHSRAAQTMASLSAEQRYQLEQRQSRFTDQATLSCSDSTGILPHNYIIVVEHKADGFIKRSWRQGDSRFVVCLQGLMQTHFRFTPGFEPFYSSIEFSTAR